MSWKHFLKWSYNLHVWQGEVIEGETEDLVKPLNYLMGFTKYAALPVSSLLTFYELYFLSKARVIFMAHIYDEACKGKTVVLAFTCHPPWGVRRQYQGLCRPNWTFSVSILIVQWQPVVMGRLGLVTWSGFFSLNIEHHWSCQRSQLASMASYSCRRQPTFRFYPKQSCLWHILHKICHISG